MFCPTWRAVLKMFATLFRIKQAEATQTKKALGDLKMPKLEEIFATVAIVWRASLRETRSFENICAINLL